MARTFRVCGSCKHTMIQEDLTFRNKAQSIMLSKRKVGEICKVTMVYACYAHFIILGTTLFANYHFTYEIINF